MASFQNFRSAFSGFNREDVVHYIEYMNNKHAAELNQFASEMSTLQGDLEAYRAGYEEATNTISLMQQQLDNAAAQAQAEAAAYQQQLQALTQELEAMKQQLEKTQNTPRTDSELEAYRRAERVERTANERVRQLFDQANGALADATAKADDTACTITQMADQVCAQLVQLQSALTRGANTIRDSAAAMYAIAPIADLD